MSEYKIGKDLDLEIVSNEKGKQKKKNGYFLLAKYTNIGYYLITPILLGVVIGFGLDVYFDSKPFFILIFIIIGFISTIYNLYRLVKEEKEFLNKHATR